jgi:hypothetical protein
MIPMDDIVVTIEHPHSELVIPLTDWISVGPALRPFLKPIAASRLSTGERLPLSAIPLRYRNNLTSRLLIRLGILQSPWPQSPQ